MSRMIFTCLALILANTVMAQAQVLASPSFIRLEPSNWKAIYAGTTELDGVALIAALEKSEQEVTLPVPMVTLMPLAPVTKKSFRLSLVAQNQANLRVSFPLRAQTVMLNGQPTLTYVSEVRPNDQFQFALVPGAEGSLVVQYRRIADENSVGEFALAPLPQLF